MEQGDIQKVHGNALEKGRKEGFELAKTMARQEGAAIISSARAQEQQAREQAQAFEKKAAALSEQLSQLQQEKSALTQEASQAKAAGLAIQQEATAQLEQAVAQNAALVQANSSNDGAVRQLSLAQEHVKNVECQLLASQSTVRTLETRSAHFAKRTLM